MWTTASILTALAATASISGTSVARPDGSNDGAGQIDSFRITGVIRDFQVSHPDFEAYPGTANQGMVLPDLGEDGKPVLNVSLAQQRGWGQNASVTSEESFYSWFRDVPGVNVSIPYTIELTRESRDSGDVFVFAKERPQYFFPIDNDGYGLSMSGLRWAAPGVHNFHFTYELETEFTYTDRADRDSDLIYKFTGDDDVFVFINGKLALDLGGVHGQQSKTVNLDEKAADLGLEPGKTYSLKLFFAERHTSESNFRIETNFVLRPAKLPTFSGLAD